MKECPCGDCLKVRLRELATPLDHAVCILRALVGDGGAVRQSGPNPLDLDIDFDHLADVVHQARVFLYRVKGDL